MSRSQQLTFITASFVLIGLIVLGMRWSVLADRIPLPTATTSAVAKQQNSEPTAKKTTSRNTRKYQPPKSTTKKSYKSEAKKPKSSKLVDINNASVSVLEKLPGIGPVLAKRIADYRKANGAFSKLADLDNVEGIGPKKLEELQGLVTFGK